MASLSISQILQQYANSSTGELDPQRFLVRMAEMPFYDPPITNGYRGTYLQRRLTQASYRDGVTNLHQEYVRAHEPTWKRIQTILQELARTGEGIVWTREPPQPYSVLDGGVEGPEESKHSYVALETYSGIRFFGPNRTKTEAAYKIDTSRDQTHNGRWSLCEKSWISLDTKGFQNTIRTVIGEQQVTSDRSLSRLIRSIIGLAFRVAAEEIQKHFKLPNQHMLDMQYGLKDARAAETQRNGTVHFEGVDGLRTKILVLELWVLLEGIGLGPELAPIVQAGIGLDSDLSSTGSDDETEPEYTTRA